MLYACSGIFHPMETRFFFWHNQPQLLHPKMILWQLYFTFWSCFSNSVLYLNYSLVQTKWPCHHSVPIFFFFQPTCRWNAVKSKVPVVPVMTWDPKPQRNKHLASVCHLHCLEKSFTVIITKTDNRWNSQLPFFPRLISSVTTFLLIFICLFFQEYLALKVSVSSI